MRTYIHAPGCTACADGVDYAAERARLSETLIPELSDAVPSLLPTGACPEWFRIGCGWPADHWTAPWLRLHAAALAAHREWGPVSDEERELAKLLADAPWGAQPDGTFITRQATAGCGGATTQLHAPNRRGVIAEVYGGRLTTWSLDAAWAFQRHYRRRSAAAEARYQAARSQCVKAIAAGQAVQFRDGQEGGYVLDSSGSFSARGIARSLGVEPPRESQCELRYDAAGWWDGRYWWRPLPQERGAWLPRRQRLDPVAEQVSS